MFLENWRIKSAVIFQLQTNGTIFPGTETSLWRSRHQRMSISRSESQIKAENASMPGSDRTVSILAGNQRGTNGAIYPRSANEPVSSTVGLILNLRSVSQEAFRGDLVDPAPRSALPVPLKDLLWTFVHGKLQEVPFRWCCVPGRMPDPWIRSF